MTAIPNKLTFRLYFRNKTKTRKILNRDFRLQRLLKKHLKEPFYEIKTKGERTHSKKENSIEFSRHLYKNLYYKTKQPPLGLLCSINYSKSKRLPEKIIKYFTFLKRKQKLNAGLTQLKKEIKAVSEFKESKTILRPGSLFLKKNESYKIRTSKLLFGHCGICFEQYGIISSKCVETAKLDIAKILRKKGRVWARVCCDTPVSARPAETRMGKGKGPISYWAAKVYPGQFFFEFSGITKTQLQEIYRALCQKSVVNLKIVH